MVTDFGFESEEALIQQYGEDYVKNAYVSDKTMDILIENAKITYEDQKDSDQQGESTDEEESGDKADASDKAESAENTDSKESE